MGEKRLATLEVRYAYRRLAFASLGDAVAPVPLSPDDAEGEYSRKQLRITEWHARPPVSADEPDLRPLSEYLDQAKAEIEARVAAYRAQERDPVVVAARDQRAIAQLDAAMESLTPQERFVLRTRFGLTDGRMRSLEETLDELARNSGELAAETDAIALEHKRSAAELRAKAAELPRGSRERRDYLDRAIVQSVLAGRRYGVPRPPTQRAHSPPPVSRERIRRIEAKALRRLRAHLDANELSR